MIMSATTITAPENTIPAFSQVPLIGEQNSQRDLEYRRKLVDKAYTGCGVVKMHTRFMVFETPDNTCIVDTGERIDYTGSDKGDLEFTKPKILVLDKSGEFEALGMPVGVGDHTILSEKGREYGFSPGLMDDTDHNALNAFGSLLEGDAARRNFKPPGDMLAAMVAQERSLKAVPGSRGSMDLDMHLDEDDGKGRLAFFPTTIGPITNVHFININMSSVDRTNLRAIRDPIERALSDILNGDYTHAREKLFAADDRDHSNSNTAMEAISRFKTLVRKSNIKSD